MRKGFFLLVSLLLSLIIPLGAIGPQIGIRGQLSGGYPSGKGLWDWTEPSAKGTLFWDGGAGGSLLLHYPVSDGISLVLEFTYAYVRGGQRLDNRSILYSQHSLEFPLLYRGKLPFPNIDSFFTAGLSPMVPLDARMDRHYSEPGKPLMLCLKVGMDYLLLKGTAGELYLSGAFTHAVTSPEFSWIAESSGSVRINRVDLSLCWMFPSGRNP